MASLSNCIYILYGQICDCYYIGQSSFFKNRFPNHVSTIKNYKYNKCDCEIAKHFNQDNHYGLFGDNLKSKDFSGIQLKIAKLSWGMQELFI